MEQNKSEFRFKKEFGQNFIFDTNFLKAVVSDLGLNKESNILEIGSGMGTLTSILATNFKKVISFEIDKTLTEKLKELEENNANLKIIFNDILRVNTIEIDKMFSNESYNIVANIPYYITSQIVFKFLLESKNLEKMFVMVQKEVGERFVANPSTSEYGIPTVILSTFGNCKMVKYVPRKIFVPVPKVDSCIIMIEKVDGKFGDLDKAKYQKFVSGCFAMKRKTLSNNLIRLGFEKDEILKVFEELNLDKNTRPENLYAKDYVNLFKKLN